jgi:thiol-disulfide isomerase/thioredoxin
MKNILSQFLSLLGFVAVASSAWAIGKKEKPSVPDVTIQQVQFGAVVNDVPFDAKDLEGKVVVVELWGVNCPPCIASLPEMQRLAKSGEKKGLVVVGMECQDSSKEAINKVLKNARVSYPVVAGGGVGFDITTIPHAAVFGSDGKLVWAGNPHNADFKREVREAMRGIKR